MWITRLYTQRIPSRMTHCLKQLSEGKTSDAAAFNQRVIGQNIRLNTETQKKSRGPIWGFTETHFTSPPCNSYTAVIMLLWLEGAAFLHHNHKNWLKTSKKQNHIFCWRLFFCFFHLLHSFHTVFQRAVFWYSDLMSIHTASRLQMNVFWNCCCLSMVSNLSDIWPLTSTRRFPPTHQVTVIWPGAQHFDDPAGPKDFSLAYSLVQHLKFR